MKTTAYEASPFVVDELNLLAEDHVPDDDEASFLNDYLAEDEDEWEHAGPMQPANEFPEE